MRNLFLFLLLVFLLKGSPVVALSVEKVTTLTKVQHLKTDSSRLELKKFDRKLLDRYHNDPDFKYDEGIAPVSSLWERFWSWVWRLISNVVRQGMEEGSGSAKLIKYIGLGLLVIFIGFLITRLAGLNLKIFSGKSKAVDVPYVEIEDNIHEIDFNTSLEKAVAAGNYRLAVRLFYLQSLKRLSDRRMIDWQPEKTNQTYIRELNDLQRKQEFKQLTLQFEYIWYGEFFIDKESFTETKQAFETFNRGLA